MKLMGSEPFSRVRFWPSTRCLQCRSGINKATNQVFADQLTCLMDTTNTAAREIHDFLASSKATAEMLEAAVATACSVESNLETVQAVTTETSSVVSGLLQGVGHLSSQLTKLFSLTEHLEEWIRAMLQYCKDIIAQVQRNTGVLLSLHGLVTNLELALRRPGINLPILELENPFGIRMALPYQLCDTWEGMCRMLVVMFFNKPGLRLVERERFVLLRAQTNFAIKPEVWSTSVAPGDKLAMSMAIERVKPRGIAEASRLTCPRCNYGFDSTLPAAQRGYSCPQCLLWWTDATDNISEDAANLSVVRPPPEPVRWDSWQDGWNWRFRRPEALSILQKAALPFERSPGAETGEDADVSCFRRIHVVPFQGNILRSLIDVGDKYRDFLLNYAANFNPDSPQLPRAVLEALKGILDEFDTLRKTDITPTAEVEARQGSQDEKAALLQWISRTTDLLMHPLNDPLLRPRVPETQIKAIIEWLRPHARPISTPFNHILDEDHVKQLYRSRLNSRQQDVWRMPIKCGGPRAPRDLDPGLVVASRAIDTTVVEIPTSNADDLRRSTLQGLFR
ncbi:hypothetical protein B0T24DRAFT_221773 [Lasiosphaeria ovina]|uniref:Ubiquitin-like domain-containing protein n=1 Tax=Lasiosphaeria ovina TaxID=92902 RepID=A0AAE0NAR8_9PEZI|nr:hypothetical protein B0T24DRAFT_221773 [Lasiosphaeria ovina]